MCIFWNFSLEKKTILFTRMLKYHFIFFFISIIFLFLMFCTEELKMGNVSRFFRFIFHDGGYIYLALIIVINAFSKNVLEQKLNKHTKFTITKGVTPNRHV